MNYFENIELFQDLTVEDQLQLSSFCQEQHMNSGEILFKQGDEPQAMYVISSGSFLIQKEINGVDETIAVLETGDLVGEMAFFGEPPVRTATVIADSESVVLVIIQFSIQQMISKYPKLYEKIQSIIKERSI